MMGYKKELEVLTGISQNPQVIFSRRKQEFLQEILSGVCLYMKRIQNQLQE